MLLPGSRRAGRNRGSLRKCLKGIWTGSADLCEMQLAVSYLWYPLIRRLKRAGSPRGSDLGPVSCDRQLVLVPCIVLSHLPKLLQFTQYHCFLCFR
jgi:hypothetical protein